MPISGRRKKATEKLGKSRCSCSQSMCPSFSPCSHGRFCEGGSSRSYEVVHGNTASRTASVFYKAILHGGLRCPPAPVQSSEPLCSCLATQPPWECTQVQHSARRSPSPPLPTCFQVCYPVCTETGNVRMVERCGAFTHIMQPGLSFLICCVDEASNHVSMRLQQIKVTCETKTKDNVFTNIEVRLVLGARRPCAPHRSPRGGSGQRRRASQSQARPPRTQAGVAFYSSRGLLYRALPPIVSRLAGVHPVPDQKGGGGDAQCLLPPLRSPPPDPGVRV